MNNVVIHLPNGNKVECESATPDEIRNLLEKPGIQTSPTAPDNLRDALDFASMDRLILALKRDTTNPHAWMDAVKLVRRLKNCTLAEARDIVKNIFPYQ